MRRHLLLATLAMVFGAAAAAPAAEIHRPASTHLTGPQSPAAVAHGEFSSTPTAAARNAHAGLGEAGAAAAASMRPDRLSEAMAGGRVPNVRAGLASAAAAAPAARLTSFAASPAAEASTHPGAALGAKPTAGPLRTQTAIRPIQAAGVSRASVAERASMPSSMSAAAMQSRAGSGVGHSPAAMLLAQTGRPGSERRPLKLRRPHTIHHRYRRYRHY